MNVLYLLVFRVSAVLMCFLWDRYLGNFSAYSNTQIRTHSVSIALYIVKCRKYECSYISRDNYSKNFHRQLFHEFLVKQYLKISNNNSCTQLTIRLSVRFWYIHLLQIVSLMLVQLMCSVCFFFYTPFATPYL